MKCFRWRCYVNNSFLVFHQGTKHSKTIKHSRFALVFHTVFSCLDPLMKHSNSLFTYNITHHWHWEVALSYFMAFRCGQKYEVEYFGIEVENTIFEVQNTIIEVQNTIIEVQNTIIEVENTIFEVDFF